MFYIILSDRHAGQHTYTIDDVPKMESVVRQLVVDVEEGTRVIMDSRFSSVGHRFQNLHFENAVYFKMHFCLEVDSMKNMKC